MDNPLFPPVTCQDCGEQYERPNRTGAIPKTCPPCRAARIRESKAAWRRRNPERNRQIQGAYYKANAKKVRAATADWNKRNPERRREIERRAYLRTFGLTPETYEAIWEAQGRCCAICGGTDPNGKGWHKDHDHATGAFRAILCGTCNSGLGLFRDDPAILRAAAEYLTRTR